MVALVVEVVTTTNHLVQTGEVD